MTNYKEQVDKNGRDIADLKQLVNNLIADVIRPMAETTMAAQQRSVENATSIQNMLDEVRADRIENRRRFDEQQQPIRAQQQAIQAMLVQMGLTNTRLDDLEAG